MSETYKSKFNVKLLNPVCRIFSLRQRPLKWWQSLYSTSKSSRNVYKM